MRTVLLGSLVGLSMLGWWVSEAEGWFCRHRQQCAPCCIVQYIVVQQQGGESQSAHVDPKSHVIRALAILDDNSPDEDFKAAIVNDGGELYKLLHSLPPGVVETSQVLRGKNVNKDSILSAIRNMRVGPEDVLFVYYNGHGKQDKNREQGDSNKGHYFDLGLNTNDDEYQRVYRSDVVNAMNAHNCVLRVLITDTCAAAAVPTQQGSEIRNKTERFKPAQKYNAVVQRNVAIFEKLMLGSTGLVNINSCELGQKAFGGIFTPIFVHEMQEWDEAKEAEPTWASFFEVVKKKTEEKSKEAIGTHELGTVGEGDKKQEVQTPFSFNDLKADVQKWEEKPAENKTQNQESAQSAPVGPAPATLRVEVPASAKFYINDMPTTATAAVRTFKTPRLEPGSTYTYTVKAELPTDGGVAEVSRQVFVQAGKVTVIDFSDPNLFRPTTAAVQSAPESPPVALQTNRPSDNQQVADR